MADRLQAKSNVDPAARHFLDPELTSEGIKQAHELGLTFPFHDRVERVFASPLQRALHTALVAFGGKSDKSNKIIALPTAQETSNAPCDTGHDIDVLEKLFPGTKIDYRYLGQDWNSKTGPWSQDDSAVKERATSLRDFLAGRPEREVVLVTHGFFLHFLTEVKRPCGLNGRGTSADALEHRIGARWRRVQIVSPPSAVPAEGMQLDVRMRALH